MLRTTTIFMAVALSSVLIACGDDDDEIVVDAPTAADAAPVVDSAPPADAPQPFDAGFRTTITGTVRSSGVALAGATITQLGSSPINRTTTGSDGSYTLTVSSEAEGYLRMTSSQAMAQQSGLVGPPGGDVQLNFDAITGQDIAAVTTALDFTYDSSKGILIIDFDGIDGAAGYGASISSEYGMVFAFDADDAPIQGATTVAGGESLVVFMNVPVGTTTVSLTAPAGQSCMLRYGMTSQRIDGNVFTRAVADCETTPAGL